MDTIRNSECGAPAVIRLSALSDVMLSERASQQCLAFMGESEVTWAQFRADVISWTQWLRMQKGRRWALCFDDSYYFAVAFMAAAHAGKHLILPGNCQPGALTELSDQFDGLLHDRTELNDFAQAYRLPGMQPQLEGAKPLAALTVGDAFLTLFTSGSSGKPKAVGKSLEVIEAEIAELERLWGTGLAQCRVISTVSHQHIYGLLFRVLWPLCAGRPFSRQTLDYPEQVTAGADTTTALITSPALLKRLGEERSAADKPYRAIFSSGGPLPLTAARQSHGRLGSLPIEVFGSTETGGIGYRQQQGTDTPWQLFGPLEMTLSPQHCLQIRSPFIEPTRWYQTDDLCVLCGERQFLLKGRADRVVKIEEKRVSLVEVEQRLSQLCWVEEAAVLPLQQGERLSLGAVITLTAQGQRQLAESGKGPFGLQLRRALRDWVVPVGIPRRFRVVEDIPVNRQGKRLVNTLVQLFDDTADPVT